MRRPTAAWFLLAAGCFLYTGTIPCEAAAKAKPKVRAAAKKKRPASLPAKAKRAPIGVRKKGATAKRSRTGAAAARTRVNSRGGAGKAPARTRPALYIMEVPPEIVAGTMPAMVPPVPDLRGAELYDSFRAARSGGRAHRAIDIMRPEGSPLVACVDGVIEKLQESTAGGTSIYLVDASGRYRFYYAHLSAYAEGLREGTPVMRGSVIGYVGSTGNASASGPHLHFQIMDAGNPTAVVNPYTILGALVKEGVQADPLPIVPPALPASFSSVPAQLVSTGAPELQQ